MTLAKLGEAGQLLLIVSICAGIISYVYSRISPGEDDLEFASTIFILTVALGLLISVIRQAPAISFGLFGAMSIVRFRAQIKKPKRMIFIVMAVAIGVCCGAGEYAMTVLGTLVLSAFSFAAFRLSANAAARREAAPPAETSALKVATEPARRWGAALIPFVLADGSRPRVLLVADEGERRILAATAPADQSAAAIVAELDRLAGEHGTPDTLTTDSWPEFGSRAARDWKKAKRIEWNFLDGQEDAMPFLRDLTRSLVSGEKGVSELDTLETMNARLEAWRQHALPIKDAVAKGTSAGAGRSAPATRLAVVDTRNGGTTAIAVGE